MKKYNSDPESVYFKKLDDKIEKFKEKHYTVNRQWRYDWNEGRPRTLKELIARREESKIDDFLTSKGTLD